MSFQSGHSENPLVDPQAPRVAPPCAIVVFGASGDLTGRKLMPAIENLALRRLLSSGTSVVGVARTEWSDDEFRERLREAVEKSGGGGADAAHVWEDFADGCRYVSGNYDDPATYDRLRSVLEELDGKRGTSGGRLYYLAIPPTAFTTVIDGLRHAELNRPPTDAGFCRLVVEKPYGRDLESARALDAAVHGAFDEADVYRIDHYLGKETVQNLLALRFSNAIFEPIWNRRYVDHVQITVAESLGVENRGSFYEQAGALRDIVQNHVMQVLSLALM